MADSGFVLRYSSQARMPAAEQVEPPPRRTTMDGARRTSSHMRTRQGKQAGFGQRNGESKKASGALSHRTRFALALFPQ